MAKKEMIVCRDCGSPFSFTDSEQRFFARQGWEKPFRCKACREKKKLSRGTNGKYAGIYEAIRNSTYKKRDTKGTFLNRSGSTWERIDDAYLIDDLFLPEWLQDGELN